MISVPPLLSTSREKPEAWFNRFTDDERIEFNALEEFIWDGKEGDKNSSLSRLFQLFAKADSFDYLPSDEPMPEAQLDINIAIGLEMLKLIADRGLPEIGRNIQCPVTVIQGTEDIRCPVDEMREPFTKVIKEFKLITIEKCGHYPWFERQARDRFFSILKDELRINHYR